MANVQNIQCSQCREGFDWAQAYQHQDIPGSAAEHPAGHGNFHPRVYCPFCGSLIADWHIDRTQDYDEWIWHGDNARLDAGKPLPPNPLTMWGKMIPANFIPPYNVHRLDLKRMLSSRPASQAGERRIGYCPACHTMRPADDADHCLKCGAALMDAHVETRQPAPVVREVKPAAKPSSPTGKILGLTFASAFILFGLYLIVATDLFAPIQSAPAPTRTRTSAPIKTKTRTPPPTRIPTRTATPAPIEVTFDTIDQYPVGQIVILTGRLALMSSTFCGTTCGLLLENPSNLSQKITIFVELSSADHTPAPNQMKPLPSSYQKSDILVRTADGTYAAVGFRIRVTGEICRTTADEACIRDISIIELVIIQ
jgi:hypothetical protein